MPTRIFEKPSLHVSGRGAGRRRNDRDQGGPDGVADIHAEQQREHGRDDHAAAKPGERAQKACYRGNSEYYRRKAGYVHIRWNWQADPHRFGRATSTSPLIQCKRIAGCREKEKRAGKSCP